MESSLDHKQRLQRVFFPNGDGHEFTDPAASVAYFRYRRTRRHESDMPTILPGERTRRVDQDLWARMGDYASRAPHESLELFRSVRTVNLQFLQRLAPD